MKKNGLSVGILGIALVVGMAVVGCDNWLTNGKDNTPVSVPAWAQGTWYTAPSAAPNARCFAEHPLRLPPELPPPSRVKNLGAKRCVK
jgi:hypothetical protein